MSWRAITGFRLVTPDPARLARFYGALGFAVGEQQAIAADEIALLGLDGSGTRLPLTLRDQWIDLDCFEHGGRPYPAEATAADLIFQHFALVTGDAAADRARAAAAGARSIGRVGSVTLPASSGGVTAVKFRDPDGHPLELLQFCGPHLAGITRIDHSAISVADAVASRAFYAARGLVEGAPTVNRGATQVELDGLDGVEVEVIPFAPDGQPPHLELLAYRHPRGRPHPLLAANDVAATRLVWSADEDALVRDPDGHLHQLSRRATPAPAQRGCAG